MGCPAIAFSEPDPHGMEQTSGLLHHWTRFEAADGQEKVLTSFESMNMVRQPESA